MTGRFEGTTVVARPIEEVFAFLADGENDPKFSPRVQEIAKATDGPAGVGTRFKSTVKDAGMTTKREFEITELVAPTRSAGPSGRRTSSRRPRRLRPRVRGRRHARHGVQRARGPRLRQAHRAPGAALGAQGRGRVRGVDQAGGRGFLGRPSTGSPGRLQLHALGEQARPGHVVQLEPDALRVSEGDRVIARRPGAFLGRAHDVRADVLQKRVEGVHVLAPPGPEAQVVDPGAVSRCAWSTCSGSGRRRARAVRPPT